MVYLAAGQRDLDRSRACEDPPSARTVLSARASSKPSHIEGETLSGIRLPGLNLQESTLTGTDFSPCILTGTDFGRATLALSNFEYAGARLDGPNTEGRSLGE